MLVLKLLTRNLQGSDMKSFPPQTSPWSINMTFFRPKLFYPKSQKDSDLANKKLVSQVSNYSSHELFLLLFWASDSRFSLSHYTNPSCDGKTSNIVDLLFKIHHKNQKLCIVSGHLQKVRIGALKLPRLAPCSIFAVSWTNSVLGEKFPRRVKTCMPLETQLVFMPAHNVGLSDSPSPVNCLNLVPSVW